jgi:ATP-dependent helicase HrpB
MLAAAYPERIAQARGKPGEYRLMSGRGVFMEPHEALAREPWLAVGELGGGAARDRILLAAALDPAELIEAFAHQIETETRVETGTDGKVRARRLKTLGALVLEERLVEKPDAALLSAALVERVRSEGLGVLPWGEGALDFRARLAFMRDLEGEAWPDLSDAVLLAAIRDWLAPLLEGRATLAVPADQLDGAIRALVPWDAQRALDAALPARLSTPAGTSAAIDYAAEGGPRVEVRVQELFGLANHPTVANGRVPLTLSLLSPARRPVQVTKDLPGFWAGSWKAVRADMRGRYPRHPWPENPLEAPPTTRAKPRGT